ncbi:MAG: futalosine hydrolase [Bacteroidetes bacterium]|nr:futalosine hydrolase [Bacteroidota bacterium]MBU1371828.1 futalosine hydrolase [Bacteroidota bacterium]MBU1483287.1 futalosine hydrolase [Bacteroidota bacterium]MBU1759726.1 futalosine hydrolase [Bacteroidota bacterium]MBU2268256.1 futalosine hydrolase [Bacteroidota bacterium]
MKILLVVATYQEIEPFIKHHTSKFNPDSFTKIEQHEVKILITGVGMVATAFALGIALSKDKFDLALNVGVAGGFYRNLKIGQLVEVREDILSELGAQDDEEFISLDQMELGEVEFNATTSLAVTEDLRKVTAITVNTIHGNADSIEDIRELLNPTIETMEGAAFFYACEEIETPAIQIRAISNYVEKRNRENWNIPLAVKNLNNWLIENIKNL